MSRATRSALNLAAATIASAVVMLAAFVTTPLVLRGLGPERLGVFRAASEWWGYFGLIELALAGALAPLLARATASGGGEHVRSLLAAGVRAYFRVALWTLLAGILLWTVLPMLVRVPSELGGEFRLGFALAIGSSVLIPLNVYRPLAEALQWSYLISILSGVQILATTVGCALAALAGWGLPGQFGVTATGGLIAPLGLLLIFRRMAEPRDLLRSTPESVEDARQLGGLNRTTFIFHLVGRVCLFTDNIIVGMLLGPAAVTSFFLTTRLAQMAAGHVQGVGNATWAGLAELYHSGQREIFRQRLTELTRLTAALSAALVVPLAALTAPFISLWVGPEQYAGELVVALAVINGALLPVFSLWGWVFLGLGRVGVLLPYMIVQGGLSLSVSLLATWLVGISGPLIGAALVNLAYNPFWLGRLLRVELAVSGRELLTATALPFVPAAMILGGLFLGYGIWPGASWIRLASELCAAAGLYFLIAWRAVLGESERTTLRRLIGGTLSGAPL